jgi:hypothetical protein
MNMLSNACAARISGVDSIGIGVCALARIDTINIAAPRSVPMIPRIPV